jgi:hypothetical protein
MESRLAKLTSAAVGSSGPLAVSVADWKRMSAIAPLANPKWSVGGVQPIISPA